MRVLVPAVLLAAVAIGAVGDERASTAGLPATAAALTPLEAINELLAAPWPGKSKQQAEDAERDLEESLEGKKLVDKDGKKNGFEWDFRLTLENIKASVNLSSPPA